MHGESATLADRPSIHGKMLGHALALIAAVGRRDAPMPIPDCCLTCAFREGSMPNQSAGTGKVALDCLLRIDRDRFACHQGMKDGAPQKICVGYVAALLAPFSEVRAVLSAFHDELAQLNENDPDGIRLAFDAWLELADPDARMDVYDAARAYAKAKAHCHQTAETMLTYASATALDTNPGLAAYGRSDTTVILGVPGKRSRVRHTCVGSTEENDGRTRQSQ